MSINMIDSPKIHAATKLKARFHFAKEVLASSAAESPKNVQELSKVQNTVFS